MAAFSRLSNILICFVLFLNTLDHTLTEKQHPCVYFFVFLLVHSYRQNPSCLFTSGFLFNIRSGLFRSLLSSCLGAPHLPAQIAFRAQSVNTAVSTVLLTVSALPAWSSTLRSSTCALPSGSLCCWIPVDSWWWRCSAPRQRRGPGSLHLYCSPNDQRKTLQISIHIMIVIQRTASYFYWTDPFKL